MELLEGLRTQANAQIALRTVDDALRRAGGKALSAIIIEQQGHH
jgi:hypothetical protein